MVVRMRVEKVDVYLLHNPEYFFTDASKRCFARDAERPVLRPDPARVLSSRGRSSKGPNRLLWRFLEYVRRPGERSGSNRNGCERRRRSHCYGIEIDPLYMDTAIDRWERMTGHQARHASGESVGPGLASARFSSARALAPTPWESERLRSKKPRRS
jgi:hypothetical protein